MTLRPDLRQEHALLAAPLGILLLDCASCNTRALAASAPTRIDVEVWDPATDVEEVRIRGRVLRHGRSQIFTDAVIEDAAHPDRCIGFGMTCFAVSGPAPAGGVSYGHGPPVEPHDDRPLTEVFGGHPKDDGGFEIPALTSALGYGRLHSGVMQVLAEAAALETVRRATGATQVMTGHLGTTVMTSGRQGPFDITPVFLGAAAGAAACRVEVLDVGESGRLIAVLSVGVRVLA